MQILQLPTGGSSSTSARTGISKGAIEPQKQKLTQDYAHVYYDSLASFNELLTNPSSYFWQSQSPSQTQSQVQSQSQGQEQGQLEYSTGRSQWQSPPRLHSLKIPLNKLVHAGFADQKFARGHRDMQRFHQHQTSQTAAILERKAQLIAHEQKRDALRLHIDELEERLEPMPESTSTGSSSSSEAALTNGSSFWQQAVSYVGTLFESETETEKKRLAATRKKRTQDKKRDDLERKVRNKKRTWQGQAVAVKKVHDRVLRLQAEKEAFQPPLSKQEYLNANAVIDVVRDDICAALAVHIQERHSHLLEQYQTLDAKTDLTRPHEWFPHARLDRRKIIYHGGPTNSGKTYQALERLKEAKKGMYLGPLRLLAVEIYEKLTAGGIYCNLYTGQEHREIPFATHGAATIEMASVTDEFDVIVIDEIQMMADAERGYGWTKALLGSRCKEIHVCGGMEAVDIVKRLVDACGDEFELRTYSRFIPLKVANKSLARSSDQVGSYKNVQPGDCVVAFSRNDIFAIKREIEKNTKYKCCVIYGSLPPQTRSEQARRFNDPDSGYDILVASDAIGMGLNLHIGRIIFNSIFKHNGSGIVRLDHSAIKQISGRAGRRNSPFPQGVVTCRSPEDMAHLRKCMATEIEPVQKAGLLPTASHIEEFSGALDNYGLGNGDNNLHKILHQFDAMATVKSDFFLCRQTPMYAIAEDLEKHALSIRDKYTLCMCPVVINSEKSMDVLKRFAEKLARGEVSGLTRSMIPRRPSSFEDLSRLCGTFNDLELFLWLQKKFPPANMMEMQAALARKDHTIKFISESLVLTDKLKLNHCYVFRDQRLREQWQPDQLEADESDMYDSDNDEALNAGVADI
jgi:ATP-dependent RNA helicase SUPV3L1/SUV3